MNRFTCQTLLTALAVSFVMPLAGAAEPANPNPYANETPVQRDARMKWWREARFGMMICWGVYAVPAGVYKDKRGGAEWIMNVAGIPKAEYQGFAKQFNPVKYDPDAWVRIAKDAGMKYIVLITKHHDGFALFDSKASDWNAVKATPYGKDLLKPLADACRKHGIKLGFYYSQAQDWCNKTNNQHGRLSPRRRRAAGARASNKLRPRHARDPVVGHAV